MVKVLRVHLGPAIWPNIVSALRWSGPYTVHISVALEISYGEDHEHMSFRSLLQNGDSNIPLPGFLQVLNEETSTNARILLSGRYGYESWSQIFISPKIET